MTKKKDSQHQAVAKMAISSASGGLVAPKTAVSKAAAIISLLKQESGTTLEEMMQATGWQKHSVRGFMAGPLRKRHGLTVQSVKLDGVRTYRAESAA